ncbi:hypothetical protein HGA89_01500, partial [bacterium]|nr:hypothetical protein [bacterium]
MVAANRLKLAEQAERRRRGAAQALALLADP